MLFVLDIGNTNTVLGVFEQDELKYEWRIKTDRHKTADEFGILFQSLFEHKGVSFSDITDIIISSVVPPIITALEEMCELYFGMEPYVVGKDDYSSLLKMNYPNPQEIGADRIVNAVAAIEKYGAPLIIIDFGTATTFCCIDENRSYSGGIITPGVHISVEALYHKASKLPKIEFEAPEHIIGKSTVEAMQSGFYYGYVCQIDGLVNKIKQQVHREPKVIATGGFSELIAKDSETIDVVDPYLTLNGLYTIYKKMNS
ncbi:type III pantothenate kinase [Candidatus Pseudothioglobus singularis]|nr:type III pantothenate kinase [Candidatus Pseudothioglobus singularis]